MLFLCVWSFLLSLPPTTCCSQAIRLLRTTDNTNSKRAVGTQWLSDFIHHATSTASSCRTARPAASADVPWSCQGVGVDDCARGSADDGITIRGTFAKLAVRAATEMMAGGFGCAPAGATGVLRSRSGSVPAVDVFHVFGHGDTATFRSPACVSSATAIDPASPAMAPKQPYCGACGCFRAKVIKASAAALKPTSNRESHTALHRRDPSLLVDRTAALVRENTALKAAVELRDRKITRLVDEVSVWAVTCSLPPALLLCLASGLHCLHADPPIPRAFPAFLVCLFGATVGTSVRGPPFQRARSNRGPRKSRWPG